MLEILIPKSQIINDETGEIYTAEKDWHLTLEHSLLSVQKWESKWHVAFLNRGTRTFEQTIDYLRCMSLTPNVPDEVFYCIPKAELERVLKYVEDPMTATRVNDESPGQTVYGRKMGKEVVTAEVIYYWMISMNIPFEYRKWHLNQLLTLIRVINAKNQPKKKKRSMRSVLEEYRSINEANKARFHTEG